MPLDDFSTAQQNITVFWFQHQSFNFSMVPATGESPVRRWRLSAVAHNKDAFYESFAAISTTRIAGFEHPGVLLLHEGGEKRGRSSSTTLGTYECKSIVCRMADRQVLLWSCTASAVQCRFVSWQARASTVQKSVWAIFLLIGVLNAPGSSFLLTVNSGQMRWKTKQLVLSVSEQYNKVYSVCSKMRFCDDVLECSTVTKN